MGQQNIPDPPTFSGSITASKEWSDKLELASERARMERANWERNYSDHMSYREFRIRRSLQSLGSGGRMDEEQAVDILRHHRTQVEGKPTPAFDARETCSKCGGRNECRVTDHIDGVIAECDTTCAVCGHKDYWAHGAFASSQGEPPNQNVDE